MDTIKLLREEVEKLNVNLKDKITSLELNESPNIFYETSCSHVGLIGEAYLNIKLIVNEIKNVGIDNYEISEKSSMKLEELDHALGDEL